MVKQENQLVVIESSSEPVISEAIKQTAHSIVHDSLNISEGQRVLVWYDPEGEPIVNELFLESLRRGAVVTLFERNFEADAFAISSCDDDGIARMFDRERELMNSADKVILIRGPRNPEAFQNVDPEKVKKYNAESAKVHQRRITDVQNGGVDWCLLMWPTEYEAEKEGFTHSEYLRLFFEACAQPWNEIKKAQAKLIEKLNAGEVLELYADEENKDPRKRTHLKMSIKGMTFCNSITKKNVPGSEVFSAPVIDSVEGQVYFPGEYIYDGKRMKNIYLRFEKGEIVEAHADENNEVLQAILANGPGARFVGEVALGTNPGLTRRFFNVLLNEKVSGSFHLAIGHGYEYKIYDGVKVNVNNGNTADKTPNHWDLTRLMHRDKDGKGGGRVVLDGVLIQQDGIFLDPELEVLNPKFK